MDTDAQRIQQPAPAPGPVGDRAVEDRRARRRRLIRNILLGLVAAIFAIWLILYVTKGRFLKGPFERIVAAQTHRPVRVRGDFQLFFDPFDIKFLAEGMTIGNPAWASKPNLFEARVVDARIAPLSLLFGKRRVKTLLLDRAAIDLEWRRNPRTNTWTFSDKKGGKPLDLPRIDRALVRGTSLRYLDPQLQVIADLRIDPIRANTGAGIGDAVELNGTGLLRRTPFRVTASLLSPNQTVARGQNKLSARMWAANNVVDVTGTLPSLAEIEDVPLQTRARGRNMADLLGIIGVVIPNTRAYRVRAQLVKTGNEYRFTRMTGTAGDSDLAGRLTVTNGERIHLDSVLTTKRLDIVDAAPFIGYNPDIVATQGAVAAAAATGVGGGRILPDAEIPVATMQRFDADLKWTIATLGSKRLPISSIDLTLDLERGRLAMSPLTFSMARGNVSSDIVFDTRQRPTLARYDIRLAPTPMGRLLAGYGVAEAGTTGTIRGRIDLTGRGDSIHDSLSTARGRIAFVMPSGTFWTRNVQLAELDIGTFAQKMFENRLKEPVRINCGLIGFTVRNGVAAADPVLIDTRQNVIVGRGGFSFRTEAIDMAVRADSKKFSLFSGQSPVGIGGRFVSPSIDPISGDLVARAGAGLGLALVATPVAGLLAFVDVGDAKSAACGPVLAGARATAQRTLKGDARDDVGRGTTAKAESGNKTGGERKQQRKKFLGIF